MEYEFLCPPPRTTVDRIGVCHSISLICIAHVAVLIRHSLRLYVLPTVIAEVTLCLCAVYVCQHTHVAFVPPEYCRQVTPSPHLKVTPFEYYSLGL
jgi:hypothetical protein